MALSFTVTGIDGLEQQLARIIPQSEQAVLMLAERVHELAVAGAETHRKTGALVDSFGHGPKKIQGGWEISSNRQRAPHGIFVHWGTRPHVIKPKTKKSLRWAAGGAFIFAKFVNHPGYKGDPFLINAANQAMREFPQMVDQTMRGR